MLSTDASSLPGYQRQPYFERLAGRLHEPRRFLQVIAGPRQTGKTTLIRQVVSSLGQPARYASADEPALRGNDWLEQQWQAARAGASLLVLDEVQKIPDWSETVKRLWDEDTISGASLRVVILGSAPVLMHRGLTESLAGRFETLQLPHWSFAEMASAFGWDLDQYIFYGGYPGAAPLVQDPQRWQRYVADALIETTISRDVLLLTRVDKPALLRRLFDLACRYSGQVLSYNKMLGQLHDAGNTTTLAHYLDLLSAAGMVTGLPRFAGDAARRRGSSPKVQVLNTALMTAQSDTTFQVMRSDHAAWGRLVESAVGAHLANAASTGECQLFYWRDANREVDFVARSGAAIAAIEVKSGDGKTALPGMEAFADAFGPVRKLLLGGDGIPVGEFLSRSVEEWVKG